MGRPLPERERREGSAWHPKLNAVTNQESARSESERQPTAWLVPPVLGLAPEAASWGPRLCNAAGAPSLIFIRTFQHQGHPHPALSRSTQTRLKESRRLHWRQVRLHALRELPDEGREQMLETGSSTERTLTICRAEVPCLAGHPGMSGRKLFYPACSKATGGNRTGTSPSSIQRSQPLRNKS